MRSVTIAALVAVAGCSSEPPPPPPAPPTDGMTLVHAGMVPRQQLRYHPTKGTKTPIELVIELDAVAGELARPMPAMVLGLTIGVDDILEDGRARIRTVVTSGTGRERAGSSGVELVTAQAAQLAGLVMTSVLAPDGTIGDTKIEETGRDLPAHIAAEMGSFRQSVEQLAMPLPEVAIGAGAIWKYRRTIAMNNLTMVSTTTVVVHAIEGDRITFTTLSALEGPDQKVTQNGVEVAIEGIHGFMSGKGVADLSRMTITGERSYRLEATMTQLGRTAPVKMLSRMRMSPVDETTAVNGAAAADSSASAGSASEGSAAGSASEGSAAGTGSADAAGSATGSADTAEPAPTVVKKKKKKRKRKPKPPPDEATEPASPAEAGSASSSGLDGI